MRTRIDESPRPRRQRLADLRNETAELHRRLSDARAAMLELGETGDGDSGPGRFHGQRRVPPRAGRPDRPVDWRPASYETPEHAADYQPGSYADDGYATPGYPLDGYHGPAGSGDPRAAHAMAEYGASYRPADYAAADYAAADYGTPADPAAGYPVPGYETSEYGAPSYVHAPRHGSDDGAYDETTEFGDAGQGLLQSAEQRTEVLVSKGRRSAFRPGLSRSTKTMIVIAAGTAVLIILVMRILPGSGASWPQSVATMQQETDVACQNSNVKSEPGQVNFACGKDTRQILWVFALLSSNGNPSFSDPQTGRVGLEPITPVQGGEVAWSLNLHHPYDPSNPIDSLQVAARAINNIIGGATVTSTDGKPMVQPGLESDPGNCRRYTGSPALSARQGFPAVCARPVAGPKRQAALVADIYRKWMVGAAPAAAHNAAVLFQNAQNPGAPAVQDILRKLLTSGPSD